MSLVKKLAKIQQELKAPKNQQNKFGGYAYRSCEDILEAVKPLLGELTLTVSDDVVEIGGRVYVKATSTVSDGETSVQNTAFAREPETQKGMNEAQITGSASSYARKYSLNGLFLIDDTKDADATNDHGKTAPKTSPVKTKTAATKKAEDKPKAETKSKSSFVKTKASPKPAAKKAEF